MAKENESGKASQVTLEMKRRPFGQQSAFNDEGTACERPREGL